MLNNWESGAVAVANPEWLGYADYTTVEVPRLRAPAGAAAADQRDADRYFFSPDGCTFRAKTDIDCYERAKAAETADGAAGGADSCGDSAAAATEDVPPPVVEDAHIVQIDVERSSSGWRYVGFDGQGDSYTLTSKDVTDHLVAKPEEFEGKLNRLEFLDGKEFLSTVAQAIYMETGKKEIRFPLAGDEVFVLKASRVLTSKIAASS